MDSSLLNSIVAIATALITVLLVERIRAKSDERRSKGEYQQSTSGASEVNTRANIALLDPLTKRLEESEAERKREHLANERKDALISYLRVGIARLIQQLREARLEPIWKPKPEDFGDELTVKGKGKNDQIRFPRGE